MVIASAATPTLIVPEIVKFPETPNAKDGRLKRLESS
jgi:hypothetical protein